MLDDKLMKFESIPCYTVGRHSYISEEFLQFPRDTKRHTVMQWFADEYRKNLLKNGGVTL